MNKDLKPVYWIAVGIILTAIIIAILSPKETPLPEKHDYLVSYAYLVSNKTEFMFGNITLNGRTLTKEHMAYVSVYLSTNLTNCISNSIVVLSSIKLDNHFIP